MISDSAFRSDMHALLAHAQIHQQYVSFQLRGSNDFEIKRTEARLIRVGREEDCISTKSAY